MYAIDSLKLISGIDIPVLTIQQIIHQPTIKEISQFGEQNFFYCVSIIASSDGKKIAKQIKEDKGIDMEFSDYEAFNQMFFSDEKNNVMIFTSFFSLLMPQLLDVKWNQYQTSFIFKNNQKKIIDGEIFDELKTIILKITGMDEIKEKSDFNPANKKASEIAEKIQRHRKIVAKEKANLSQDNGDENSLSNMISCMSTISGLTLQEVSNYTYYQLIKQYQRALLLDSYHIQMSMSAFSGIDEDKIINWMKKI